MGLIRLRPRPSGSRPAPAPEPEPVVNASAPVWARYDLPFLLGALALVLVALESLLSISLPVLRAVRPREAA